MSKLLANIIDTKILDRECNCNKQTIKYVTNKNGEIIDQKCLFENKFRISMIVNKLTCKCTGKFYIGKTQNYLKHRTMEHFQDNWKVINSGRKKFDENWRGSGGHDRCDGFARHFAQECRHAKNYNEIQAFLKDNIQVNILWKCDRIRCMKSSKTMRCKICMVERKAILASMRKDNNLVLNLGCANVSPDFTSSSIIIL